jgi:hypothetical protein
MLVQVMYSVPVTCTVNTETGDIESVEVWGGDMKRTKDVPLERDSQEPAPKAEAKKAVRIAENESWPAWDHEG